MTATFACSGLSCRNRVNEAGQVCSSCWLIVLDDTRHDVELDSPNFVPHQAKEFAERGFKRINRAAPIRPMPVGESIQSLRMKLHDASFRLNFGTEQEKAAALPVIVQLAAQLQGIK